VTLPQYVSALFLLIVGGGVLAVAWHAYHDGVLPAGSHFFKGRWMPSREANPAALADPRVPGGQRATSLDSARNVLGSLLPGVSVKNWT
jgi:hypothetical protein